MFHRQLFDSASSTYTYVLADERTGEAALVDPVREHADRDAALVRELGFELVYILETHVHADHITGAAALRARTGAATVAHELGARCADIHVAHGAVLPLGDLTIDVLATPGHTPDSTSYRLGAHVFTGDALMIRGTGRADFQHGDPGTLYDSITRVLFALPDATAVWPAHDYRGMTQSSIGEEKRLNPRIAGRSRNEFIAIMRGLVLPPPRALAEAVPANQECGNGS